MKELLDNADLNNDGLITKAEFKNDMERTQLISYHGTYLLFVAHHIKNNDYYLLIFFLLQMCMLYDDSW